MENITVITQCPEQRRNGSRDSTNGGFYYDLTTEFPPESPRQLHERLLASGYPESLADLTFDSLTVDEHNREKIQTAKAFAENPAGGLFICGEFGTGKTWLAAAIGNAVARRHKRINFGTFSGIADKLISSQKYGEFPALWEKYTQKVDLLIIDDIGKEKPTDWKLQTLFKLIDERGSGNLPIIFTSNYGLSKLCERISPDDDDGITAGAIKDRLRCFTPLMLGGGSRRKR